MQSNNTKIHFATGVKMLYLFPQIPPPTHPFHCPFHMALPLAAQGGGAFHEMFQQPKTYLRKLDIVLAAAYAQRAWSQPHKSPQLRYMKWIWQLLKSKSSQLARYIALLVLKHKLLKLVALSFICCLLEHVHKYQTQLRIIHFQEKQKQLCGSLLLCGVCLKFLIY